MQDRELYRQILGVESPWKVERLELSRADGEVHVFLEHDEQVRWPCRQCSAVCALHDHQPERRWRHLDTCQYRTILHARPPRSDCTEHGPRVVRLPWAEASSRFTALFEALAISWLKEASQQGIAEFAPAEDTEPVAESPMERAAEPPMERAAEPHQTRLDRIEDHPALSLLLVAGLLFYLVDYGLRRGLSSLDPNVLNLGFVTLGLLLHGSPRRYVRAFSGGVSAVISQPGASM